MITLLQLIFMLLFSCIILGSSVYLIVLKIKGRKEEKTKRLKEIREKEKLEE